MAGSSPRLRRGRAHSLQQRSLPLQRPTAIGKAQGDAMTIPAPAHSGEACQSESVSTKNANRNEERSRDGRAVASTRSRRSPWHCRHMQKRPTASKTARRHRKQTLETGVQHHLGQTRGLSSRLCRPQARADHRSHSLRPRRVVHLCTTRYRYEASTETDTQPIHQAVPPPARGQATEASPCHAIREEVGICKKRAATSLERLPAERRRRP